MPKIVSRGRFVNKTSPLVGRWTCRSCDAVIEFDQFELFVVGVATPRGAVSYAYDTSQPKDAGDPEEMVFGPCPSCGNQYAAFVRQENG